MDYNFHWRPVFKSLPDLLESALLTLEVAILSMILGILFGLVLSLIRIKMTGPFKVVCCLMD
jgi:polar amino acid transport system permease protein